MGTNLPDAVVKYQVLKKKRLPKRPENFRDEAFALIEGTCQYDPSKRLTVQELVAALNKLRK